MRARIPLARQVPCAERSYNTSCIFEVTITTWVDYIKWATYLIFYRIAWKASLIRPMVLLRLRWVGHAGNPGSDFSLVTHVVTTQRTNCIFVRYGLQVFVEVVDKEFPCATIKTFFPSLIEGAITSFQYGTTRNFVVANDSVKGNSSYRRGIDLTIYGRLRDASHVVRSDHEPLVHRHTWDRYQDNIPKSRRGLEVE